MWLRFDQLTEDTRSSEFHGARSKGIVRVKTDDSQSERTRKSSHRTPEMVSLGLGADPPRVRFGNADAFDVRERLLLDPCLAGKVGTDDCASLLRTPPADANQSVQYSISTFERASNRRHRSRCPEPECVSCPTTRPASSRSRHRMRGSWGPVAGAIRRRAQTRSRVGGAG